MVHFHDSSHNCGRKVFAVDDEFCVCFFDHVENNVKYDRENKLLFDDSKKIKRHNVVYTPLKAF